jgi:hypothetical protein
MALWILFCFLFLGIVTGGKLVRMVILTSDEFEAGMIWPTGKVRYTSLKSILKGFNLLFLSLVSEEFRIKTVFVFSLIIFINFFFSFDICGTSFGDCCQIHDLYNEEFPLNFKPGETDKFSGGYLQG